MSKLLGTVPAPAKFEVQNFPVDTRYAETGEHPALFRQRYDHSIADDYALSLGMSSPELWHEHLLGTDRIMWRNDNFADLIARRRIIVAEHDGWLAGIAITGKHDGEPLIAGVHVVPGAQESLVELRLISHILAEHPDQKVHSRLPLGAKTLELVYRRMGFVRTPGYFHSELLLGDPSTNGECDDDGWLKPLDHPLALREMQMIRRPRH